MRCAEGARLRPGRRRRAAQVVAVVALAAGSVQAQTATIDNAAGLGWLRDLAGACWEGGQADGTPADTQCYTLQFGRHLRGTIEISGPAGAPPRLRGDSVWSWDPDQRKLTVATWSDRAPVGVIEAVFDGDRVRFAFGPQARSYWERTGPDSFSVVRERRDGDAWREDRRVDYRRAPAR